MKEELIQYETAVILKSKGFNIPCRYSFSVEIGTENVEEEDCVYMTGEESFTEAEIEAAKENGYYVYLRPTQALVQRWLRDYFDIHVWCEKQHKNVENTYGYRIGEDLEHSTFTFNNWNYEESLESGLKEALYSIKDGRKTS